MKNNIKIRKLKKQVEIKSEERENEGAVTPSLIAFDSDEISHLIIEGKEKRTNQSQ